MQHKCTANILFLMLYRHLMDQKVISLMWYHWCWVIKYTFKYSLLFTICPIHNLGKLLNLWFSSSAKWEKYLPQKSLQRLGIRKLIKCYFANYKDLQKCCLLSSISIRWVPAQFSMTNTKEEAKSAQHRLHLSDTLM